MMILFALCVVLPALVLQGVTAVYQSPKHPCDRTCDGTIKECEYTFNVQLHYTMAKACGACSINGTGCNNTGCIPADGRPRLVMVVNNMMPGPLIMVCHNDIIKVKVINNLLSDESITIHWHGIQQKDTQYMDGAHMFTQCPIHRGNSFVYKFKADPPGTHWWHAHSAIHRGEGINGALIINQPSVEDMHSNEYDIDTEDHVIVISDWSQTPNIERLIRFDESGITFFPDSILINGIGYTNKNESNLSFRQSFTVVPGKRHRFRVISNGVVLCPVDISLDHHMLTVISLDGSDIVPYDVTNIVVRSGETIDFVVNANQPPANYWMRFVSSVECSSTHDAILNYAGISKDIKPTSTSWDPSGDEYKQLNPVSVKEDEKHIYLSSMEPLFSDPSTYDMRLNGYPDEVHYIGGDITSTESVEFNNITNKIPVSPLMSQPEDIDALCNPADPNIDLSKYCSDKGHCICNYIIDIRLGSVVDLVIFDESRIPMIAGHTIHLHGYRFVLLKMDKVHNGRLYKEDVEKIYEDSRDSFDATSSVRKDTFAVSSSGYAVVRFVADNPGVWLFHCHLGIHSVFGMSLSIRVGYPDHIPAAPKNFPRCGSWEEEDIPKNQMKSSLDNFLQFLRYLKTSPVLKQYESTCAGSK